MTAHFFSGTVLCFFFLSLSLAGQTDSTGASDSAAIPLSLDLSGGFSYQNVRTGSYYYPAYFGTDQEYSQTVDENYPWREESQRYSDNPLYHGAGYFRLGAVSQPIEEARLEVALIGEMRGMSYGTRNMENMIVYPKFFFTFRHALPLLGDTLHSMVEVGDHHQLESLVPLTFYNIDAQGSRFTLGYRWLEYLYEKAAGDGAFTIGLNIDDANHHALRTRDLSFLDSTSALFQAGIFHYSKRYFLGSSLFESGNPRFADSSPRDSMTRASGLSPTGLALLTRLERELASGLDGNLTLNYALRLADIGDRLMSRSAFLLSAGLDLTGEDGFLGVSGSYRFYGGLFNAGFRNDDVSYREEAEDEEKNDDFFDRAANDAGYANTIGRSLYSLQQLDYPFSQWAVFTEYQDLKDVTGWTLYAEGRWRFTERFFLGGMLDLNLIVPEKIDAELYPFFSCTFGYEPYPGITAEAGITNRTMNLDKHYPTHYLIEGIAGMGSIRWRTGW